MTAFRHPAASGYRIRIPAAVLLVLGAASCSRDSSVAPVTVLDPVASTSATPSRNHDIALLSDEVACIIDSYETQVRCGDREGRVIGVIGREGDGPGEFRTISGIERGPQGSLLALDRRLARLMHFRPDGARLQEAPMPALFSISSVHQNRVYGYRTEIPSETSAAQGMQFVPTMVDAYSGAVVWERRDLPEAANRPCLEVHLGAVAPQGRLGYWACEREMVFFDGIHANRATVVESPPNSWARSASEID